MLASGIVGFCCVDVKPFGPTHEYVPPASVDAVRIRSWPAQIGPPFAARGASGQPVYVKLCGRVKVLPPGFETTTS